MRQGRDAQKKGMSSSLLPLWAARADSFLGTGSQRRTRVSEWDSPHPRGKGAGVFLHPHTTVIGWELHWDWKPPALLTCPRESREAQGPRKPSGTDGWQAWKYTRPGNMGARCTIRYVTSCVTLRKLLTFSYFIVWGLKWGLKCLSHRDDITIEWGHVWRGLVPC